jgi:hypothetical protein
MKLVNLYNYNAGYLSGGAIIPDEMDYLLEIVELVADYFSNSKYNFYITNRIDFHPETENNIIFSSACEAYSKLHTDNFLLCFSNFLTNSTDTRYLPFPLGVNKFINKLIKKEVTEIPFSQRQYDCFFAGYIHPSRYEFLNSLKKLTGNNYFYFATGNNLQSFERDLSPEDYFNIARNSKIMLCPAGGLHTSSYRYFESLYCKNIAIYPKNKNHSIFFEEENPLAFCVNSWNDLNDNLVSSLINTYTDKEKYFDTYFKNTTCKLAVAQSIIKSIENKILKYYYF